MVMATVIKYPVTSTIGKNRDASRMLTSSNYSASQRIDRSGFDPWFSRLLVPERATRFSPRLSIVSDELF